MFRPVEGWSRKATPSRDGARRRGQGSALRVEDLDHRVESAIPGAAVDSITRRSPLAGLETVVINVSILVDPSRDAPACQTLGLVGSSLPSSHGLRSAGHDELGRSCGEVGLMPLSHLPVVPVPRRRGASCRWSHSPDLPERRKLTPSRERRQWEDRREQRHGPGSDAIEMVARTADCASTMRSVNVHRGGRRTS